MTYAPQPGTIPARAIAHLHGLPAGTELSTVALCDALGHGDANAFRVCMQKALLAGLVKSTRRAGILTLFWSLGDGVPLVPSAPPQDEDEREEPLTATPPNPSAWQLPPRSVFDLAQADSSDGAEPELMQDPAPLPRLANALGWTPAPPEVQLVNTVSDEELEDAQAASEQPPLFVDSATDEDFACALWSDGRLQLQQIGEEMVLSVKQTRALMRYLERMAVDA